MAQTLPCLPSYRYMRHIPHVPDVGAWIISLFGGHFELGILLDQQVTRRNTSSHAPSYQTNTPPIRKKAQAAHSCALPKKFSQASYLRKPLFIGSAECHNGRRAAIFKYP